MYSGRKADAALALTEGAKVLSALMNEDLTSTEQFPSLLAHTFWELANAWVSLKRFDDAEQANQKALKVFKVLQATHPESAFYQQEEAFTHRQLSGVAGAAGRGGDVERHLRQAY